MVKKLSHRFGKLNNILTLLLTIPICFLIYKYKISTLNSNFQQLLDLPNFFYLQTPPTCPKSPNLILILVHSARSHIKEREIYRQTLGSVKQIKEWNLRLVFLLGQGPSKIEDDANDLVVGSFEDSIRNLTYKHIMGYKWTWEYCGNSEFVLKIDDDAFVDLFRVVDLLNSTQNGYFCREWQVRVERGHGKRFSVTYEEYPKQIWPKGCLGFAFLLRSNALKEILKFQEERFGVGSQFPRAVDDVWVTGVLREGAGIGLENIQDKYYTDWGGQGHPEKVIKPWYKDTQGKSPLPWIFVLLSWKDPEDSFEVKMKSLWNKTISNLINIK